MTYEEKKQQLVEAMKQYGKEDVAIAFSGGVDSSLLLKLACENAASGKKVHAVTIHTRLHPMNDLEIAREVAEETGAIHAVVYVDELQDAGILNNPVDRCYKCKKCLFQKLLNYAEEKKITTILEGTNEDDLFVYRPGIKAVRELGISSPLAQMGFTKEEVRKFAAEKGCSVAHRPSTPCLATRFPYNTQLSYHWMEQVEIAENLLREMGLYNVRVRMHGEIARIEVDEEDMHVLVENRSTVTAALKNLGFHYITMDLAGFRSGSMDEYIKKCD